MSAFRLLRMVGRANPIAVVRHHRAVTSQMQAIRYISSAKTLNPTGTKDNESSVSTKSPQDLKTKDVKTKISDLITKSDKKIFVFMKGTPKHPECRYSGIVTQILDAYELEYDSCNVLDDLDIRQGIKEYSNWPTIPQVYKDGSFIGGCDILLQMHESGELKKLSGMAD